MLVALLGEESIKNKLLRGYIFSFSTQLRMQIALKTN